MHPNLTRMEAGLPEQAPRAETERSDQAELGKMAEPPGGKGPHKSPTWHFILSLAPHANPASPCILPVTRSPPLHQAPSQLPFSADVTSVFLGPESLLLRARLFRFLQLLLLKLYPQQGSSFRAHGMEYI